MCATRSRPTRWPKDPSKPRTAAEDSRLGTGVRPSHESTRRNQMAELTVLDEKLAEVLGLAQAAQDATEKVIGLVEDEQVKSTLQQMNQEAAETEQRVTQVADGL